MEDDQLLILSGHEVQSLLAGREQELIRTVRTAYEVYSNGGSSLPQSTFLRFPDNPRNRIIALPAQLGDGFEAAGLKWIASFPGNHELGLDRASAVVILNSTITGRPEAILEGSIISAKRTAASAALAAQYLSNSEAANRIGLIGCGVISFEIVRFLLNVYPEASKLVVFDVHDDRAAFFQRKCRETFPGVEVEIAAEVTAILNSCKLVSLATTALKPHIFDLSKCAPGTTVLHVSLRDLSPEVILSTENIVDDVDHVCRAETSIHLAEQIVGHRDFMRGTLAEVTQGVLPARKDNQSTVVFSPFGLGILDIAVSDLVRKLAREQGRGMVIKSFLPEAWARESQTAP
jgi:N-[(2S)-2-amino-2-carboxyethyl]-L-glutamate dehydrogenase